MLRFLNLMIYPVTTDGAILNIENTSLILLNYLEIGREKKLWDWAE